MIIKNNPEYFESYVTDSSNMKGSAEILFIPENQNELIECIKDCYEKNLPYTISGAGTGLTGARVPFGGAVISTEKLNKIISFDEDKRLIKVEPAVTLKELNDFLSSKGFFYPPNPTEYNSSIGGNIANNSSGARTFKYGPTRNYVENLEIILADGDEINLSRKRDKTLKNNFVMHTKNNKYEFEFNEIQMPETKNATGYYLKNDMDLLDIFIGNEGTLGVIKNATLKVLPIPESVLGGIAFFNNYNDLLSFVDKVRAESRFSFKNEEIKSISFRLIEFFDSNSLDLIRANFNQIPQEANSAIWFEQEYKSGDEEAIINLIYERISEFTNLADNTIIALTDKEHFELSELRHSIPLAVFEMIAAGKFQKTSTDTAIPVEYFSDFFHLIQDKLRNSGMKNVVFGHIGDCHLHCNLLPQTIDEFQLATEIYHDLIVKTLEYNGSVSAEHGIGKLKKHYFQMMIGDDIINEMKNIKKIFDRKHLLGIGNIFD